MKWVRGRVPSPALLIACVALFMALGGTASALRGHGSVKSNDIAARAVTTKKLAGKAVKNGKIAPGAIDAAKTRFLRTGGADSEVSTTSTAPTDLGGPYVTVKAPAGALIAVEAQVDMRATGGKANRAQVSLYQPGLVKKPVQILSSAATAGFQRRLSAPVSAEGVTNHVRSGWIVMPTVHGTFTFSLRYNATGGTAIFTNRHLWVTVIR